MINHLKSKNHEDFLKNFEADDTHDSALVVTDILLSSLLARMSRHASLLIILSFPLPFCLFLLRLAFAFSFVRIA